MTPGKLILYFSALALAAGTSIIASALQVSAGSTFAGNNALLNELPIPTAIRFPVVFKTAVSTRHANGGDVIEAVLKDDLRIDDQLVAEAGSMLVGHLEEVASKPYFGKGRRPFVSLETRLCNVNKKSFRLLFDQIVTAQNEAIEIVGVASKQKIDVISDGSTRVIVVGNYGELERSERALNSGRKILVGALQHGVKQGDSSPKREVADIECGDVLLVQAHSPYELPKASAQ